MTPLSQTMPRLSYLDGLRGATALYIVLCHVYWELCPDGSDGLPYWLVFLLYPFTFSNKVGIFMVLSGYALTLPLVRAKRSAPHGGVKSFLRRRARRILPPYYAALALTLFLIAVVPQMQILSGVRWDISLPAFRPGVLLSHLLLLHNMHPNWVSRINNPMWSLAIEWQMYFIFTFLLLPAWRRYGFAASLIVGFVIGYLPRLLLPTTWNYDWTSPWYIALFTLGMAAAVSSANPRKARPVALSGMIVSGLMLAGMIKAGTGWWNSNRPAADLMIGVFCACFLTLSTESVLLNRPGLLVRWLESRPLIKLGAFSYSLYLVHFPLLSLLHLILRFFFTNAGSDFVVKLTLLYLIGVPLSIWAGYGFHLAFERPFLRRNAPESLSDPLTSAEFRAAM